MSGDEARAAAVTAAEAGTQAWEVAARHQRSAEGDHSDFYALACELFTTLSALHSLVLVLRQHTVGYQDVPGIYDDTRGGPAPVDPHTRLTLAAHALAELGDHLDAAGEAANTYWSAIGHIGVDLPRELDGGA